MHINMFAHIVYVWFNGNPFVLSFSSCVCVFVAVYYLNLSTSVIFVFVVVSEPNLIISRLIEWWLMSSDDFSETMSLNFWCKDARRRKKEMNSIKKLHSQVQLTLEIWCMLCKVIWVIVQEKCNTFLLKWRFVNYQWVVSKQSEHVAVAVAVHSANKRKVLCKWLKYGFLFSKME